MLKLIANTANTLAFGNDHIRVNGKMPGMMCLDRITAPPRFGEATIENTVLAGMEGTCCIQHATTDGIGISRKIFSDKNQSILAIKLSFTNKTTQPLFLDKVSVLRCTGDASLFVGGSMQHFRCLKLGRHKLDVPAVFRPSTVDDAYRDASFQAHKLRAGLGVQGNTQDFYSMDKIFSEPAFFIKNDTDATGDGLGMCVLGQSKHLTSFILSPAKSKQALRQFDVSLEYDGIQLAPWEMETTHWVVFYTAHDERAAIQSYSELLASYTHISPPRERAVLYCSWYFYGREFCEADLIENVKSLQEKQIPVDAFIIDNGWMDNFGDFNANSKFPSDMEKMADCIGSAGFTPGIWTCPFMLMPKSKMFQKHPELAAKKRDGTYAMFHYIEGDCHIVDTTQPYCAEYFDTLYAKINGWGYQYHKMDFMRAPVVNDDMAFYNSKDNRASAYHKGHLLLRHAIGEDRYFLSCGGIYDAATLGIADSVRAGSDAIGSWDNPFAGREGSSKIQVKQAMFRNYLNRFCNVDPDSLMLRRRDTPFRKQASPIHDILSNGLFTDNEAQAMVAKQYICGGNINFSERMVELPEDRRMLLSKVIPPIAPPAAILDYDNPDVPTLCLTKIENAQTSYFTLTIFNWLEREVQRKITPEQLQLPKEFQTMALFEFFSQKFLGIVGHQDTLQLHIPPHGVICVRITSVKENAAFLVGTDCHMSMGGYEITNLRETNDTVSGSLATKWNEPVKITAVKINKGVAVWKTITFPNKTNFTISFSK